ncbi:MAG TPA: hypothetical protein VFO46_02450 [Candidatus Sulfotelmatobacter sp.]|nr:hypothetical protein [Candidatus Sulfotelmatobacter sp.]
MTPEPAIETAAKCLKCTKDLDTTGKPVWCKACRAQYHREYEALKKKQEWTAGVEAMRGLLAREFDNQGSGRFTGYECADLIWRCPAPERQNGES